MTTIYLIRHAEADGNFYRRAQGQYDANITMLGRRQVAALAQRFRDVPVDALWSSDLVRTQSTASAILKYHPGLTLHTDPALREVDIGVWEGRPWGNIAREEPEQHGYFTGDPARWHVAGSEDYAAVQDRMERALLGLGDAYPGKTVAVVSHAFAIRALCSRLMGVPFGRMPFGDNTSVTTLTADNGALRVEQYADGSHLGALSTFAHQGLAGDHLGRKADGNFRPMDLPAEAPLYADCYRRTWLASHGDLAGFSPEIYLASAARRAQADPQCLEKLFLGEDFAGLIELDPERGARDGAGWISLVWVEPSFRGRRLGAQLIGHGAGYFRALGRRAIRLHVSRTNAAAIGFYETVGFVKRGVTEGVGGPLYLMELDIAPRVWSLP